MTLTSLSSRGYIIERGSDDGDADIERVCSGWYIPVQDDWRVYDMAIPCNLYKFGTAVKLKTEGVAVFLDIIEVRIVGLPFHGN